MNTPVGENSIGCAAILPTRKSERQLRGINKSHGRYSMAFLQRELAGYIYYHEQAGYPLDPKGHVLRYDSRISVLVRQLGAVWYILRVWQQEAEAVCHPVYIWQAIRYGWATAIARVLAGWRYERVMPMRA